MKHSKWKKRTIAIASVIALVSSIVFYTNFKIKAEVNRIEVTVSKENIPPRTKIKSDMLQTIVVASESVPPTAIKDQKEIINKWTQAGYGIPKNGYFYDENTVSQKDMPDAGILELKEGEVAFPLLVDLETSLGNSIIPNTSVDLYFRSIVRENDTEKSLYGKLASQVRVVSVKDQDASNVFDPTKYEEGKEEESSFNNTETKSLAKIYIFAIPSELNDLLNKAKLLGEVVPIATGKQSKKETTDEISQVENYINSTSYKSEKPQNTNESGEE